MPVFALQAVAEGGGQIESVARTFGVDWTHLFAQTVSFVIVCAVLYVLAYKPILAMLATRREQIAAGLANAEKIKAELARIEVERQDILRAAGERAKLLIEEARTAAVAVGAKEAQKAAAAADEILIRAHQAAERDRARMVEDLKHEVGRLVVLTTASVTGKILTDEDHRRLADETTSQLAM